MIAMRGQLRFHHELTPYTERVLGLLETAMNLGLDEAMYKLAGAAVRWWLQHQNTTPPPRRGVHIITPRVRAATSADGGGHREHPRRPHQIAVAHRTPATAGGSGKR